MRTTGRTTQGVRLINLSKKQDEIASIAKVPSEKLLEGEEFIPEDEDSDVNDVVSEGEPTDTRITSYNVCYTKLLRQ